jgi:hypothetical protein
VICSSLNRALRISSSFVLPASRRYGVALANYAVTRVDEALEKRNQTRWNVKHSDVRKGDRLVIRRGKEVRGKRGVIAFAEALSDPADQEEAPEEAAYFVKPPRTPRPPRFLIRYEKHLVCRSGSRMTRPGFLPL